MIYFDNAATSWPKPPEVSRAVLECMDAAGGNPGRGTHALSLAAARTVYECRELLAAFAGLPRPENVVFTYNTTYALNIAIQGLCRPRSRVLCSALEHNSVIRPLTALECDIGYFDPFAEEEKLLCDISHRLDGGVSLVVCCHSSNVLPVRLPVGRISRLCRVRGVPCIIDAAQSAGVLDIDMSKITADAVCLPGHKGLYGPCGCGAVLFGSSAGHDARRIRPLVSGGSGVNSADAYMPDMLPERLEAGTLGVPAIAGLAAGIRVLNKTGVANIREHEYALAARAREMLGNIPGVTQYIPSRPEGSIALFNIDGMSAETVAARLDGEGICVRAGLHCSPAAHRAAGTLECGAVRASFGAFNTMPELERFAAVISSLAADAGR